MSPPISKPCAARVTCCQCRCRSARRDNESVAGVIAVALNDNDFLALLLANALTLSLLLYERMSSARSVIRCRHQRGYPDRLPAQERPHWLARLARGNYRYQLSAGQTGDYPTSWRTRDAVRSLQEALSGRYPVSIIAVPGPREHIQAHVTLRDGAPLSIDLWPKLPAIARWLPLVLVAQFLLLLFCAWYAVRRWSRR